MTLLFGWKSSPSEHSFTICLDDVISWFQPISGLVTCTCVRSLLSLYRDSLSTINSFPTTPVRIRDTCQRNRNQWPNLAAIFLFTRFSSGSFCFRYSQVCILRHFVQNRIMKNVYYLQRISSHRNCTIPIDIISLHYKPGFMFIRGWIMPWGRPQASWLAQLDSYLKDMGMAGPTAVWAMARRRPIWRI